MPPRHAEHDRWETVLLDVVAQSEDERVPELLEVVRGHRDIRGERPAARAGVRSKFDPRARAPAAGRSDRCGDLEIGHEQVRRPTAARARGSSPEPSTITLSPSKTRSSWPPTMLT